MKLFLKALNWFLGCVSAAGLIAPFAIYMFLDHFYLSSEDSGNATFVAYGMSICSFISYFKTLFGYNFIAFFNFQLFFSILK